MRIRAMILEPHLRETNPYAPLATVVSEQQLMPDESAAKEHSILLVWPAAWLTTTIAGGVFGFGVLLIGGNVPFAFFGLVFGIAIAGLVAFPVSTILYAIIAVVTRKLTSNTAMMSAGVCGAISGAISSTGMILQASWSWLFVGWVLAAGLVGAVVPAMFVKMFFK